MDRPFHVFPLRVKLEKYQNMKKSLKASRKRFSFSFFSVYYFFVFHLGSRNTWKYVSNYFKVTKTISFLPLCSLCLFTNLSHRYIDFSSFCLEHTKLSTQQIDKYYLKILVSIQEYFQRCFEQTQPLIFFAGNQFRYQNFSYQS